MALLDRVREAWDDLRGIPKEAQEASSTAQAVAESPIQWAKDYKAAFTPGETVGPVSLDRDGDTYSAAKRDVEPALQAVADEHYRGRLDLVSEKDQLQVGDQVAERTGLPVVEVHDATEDFVLNAFIEQKRLSSERLNPAVGEEHSSEFRLRERDGEVWTFEHKPTGQQIHLDASGRFHDLEEGRPSLVVSRDEILDRFQKLPDSTLLESPVHRGQWETLEKAVGYHGADNFEHYSQRGDVHVYRQVVEEQDRFIGLDSKGRFYEVDQDSFKPEARISREAALEFVNEQPHFYTPAEPTPTHKDWSRLEEAVGRENAREFSFKGEITTGVQSFQHDQTGNHVYLDFTGQFHNADHQPITRDIALSQALPAQVVDSSRAVSVAAEPMRVESLGQEQSISM